MSSSPTDINPNGATRTVLDRSERGRFFGTARTVQQCI
jgi:hypothetical protein